MVSKKQMNILDIILAIPLLWALYRGFRKGLIYMIASLTALVVGIAGAVRFHSTVGVVIQNWFTVNPEHLNLISFATTFVLIVLVVHLVAFLIDKLIKAIALSLLNRAAGMIFGLLVTGFVISIVLMPIDAANKNKEFISPETIDGSLLYAPLKKLAPTVFPYLKKEEFRKYLPLIEKDMEVDSGTVNI